MPILHGHLQYSPKNRGYIQLLDSISNREFDIWPYVDTPLLSLSGIPVLLKEDEYSFSLTQGGTDFVFQYSGSLTDMWLKINGTNKTVDVTEILDMFLARLNGQRVVVEADNEHFKISAVQSETV